MSSSSHRQEAEPLIQYSTQQQPDLPQPKTNLSVVRHTHTHTHTHTHRVQLTHTHTVLTNTRLKLEVHLNQATQMLH